MLEASNQDGVARSTTRVRGFVDPEMDFQLLRSLGAANYMGGAFGEIFAAVRNINWLKRREFVTLLGGTAAWPLAARAQ